MSKILNYLKEKKKIFGKFCSKNIANKSKNNGQLIDNDFSQKKGGKKSKIRKFTQGLIFGLGSYNIIMWVFPTAITYAQTIFDPIIHAMRMKEIENFKEVKGIIQNLKKPEITTFPTETSTAPLLARSNSSFVLGVGMGIAITIYFSKGQPTEVIELPLKRSYLNAPIKING